MNATARQKVSRQMWKWLLFTIGMGVTPVIADGISVAVKGTGNLMAFVARGDLLVVSSILCGASIGEILTATKVRIVARYQIGFCCAFLFFLSGWEFVALCRAEQGTYVDSAGTLAIILFGFSVFTSTLAVFYAQWKA